MDPLAHTLVGGALAEAGLKRQSRYATATLVIGANLPDIDAATMLLGGDAALFYRRGWTHGILAMLVLPLLLVGALWLWHRWRGASLTNGAAAFRPGALLVLALLAVWSHPLLDWLNTYGVRLLMPFDGSWFYGDTLFIIDPWLWLLCAAGIVLAHSRSRPVLTGWLILAAVSSGLILGSGFVGVGAKLLWLSGLGVIGLLRLRMAGQGRAELVARGGLTLLLLYVGTAYLLARGAESTLHEQFAGASVVQANPVPGNPMAHRLLVVEEESYRIVSATGEEQRLPREAADEVLRRALASPDLRGFSNWMRFPYWETEETEGEWRVSIWDLRYRAPGQPEISPIGFERVVLPKPADQPDSAPEALAR